jgi:hypothetical protein
MNNVQKHIFYMDMFFTPGVRATSTHWVGSWVGPRVSLEAVKNIKILHCRESNPDHSAHSTSLPTEPG